MRRQLGVAVALLLAVAARAQTRGAVDWIFLVDTSRSMADRKIFDDVQGSLGTFIDEASDGDSVSLYTFDRGVDTRSTLNIDASTREDLLRAVGDLKAEGKRTHLGAAIAKGLDRADFLKARGDPTRTRAIVLFTDGKEDVKGIEHPVPIPSNVARALNSDAYLFFISLGDHEKQLDAFTNAHILKPTDADEIRRLAGEIRTIVKPKPALITVTPQSLRLGSVARGAFVERELIIDSDKPAVVAVRLDEGDGVTMTPQTNLQAPAHVKLRFAIGKKAQPGARNLTLHVSTIVIPVSVSIPAPSLIARIVPWLIALLVVAIALAGWLISRKKKSELEGELEILQPRVAADAAFVGLPRLQTSEIALSAILPPEPLAGSDARLFTRRRDGDKKVFIAASSGSLRVNDVETPLCELFDADTIRIGEAKLRFNHVGHERPQEDLA